MAADAVAQAIRLAHRGTPWSTRHRHLALCIFACAAIDASQGNSESGGPAARDISDADFRAVLKRLTVRGSIAGTRKDLEEALEFAADGKVQAHIHRAKLEDINQVLADLKAGKVDGRVVLEY